MKKALILILPLFLIGRTYSQSAGGQVEQAIQTAYETQDPQAGLNTLLSIKGLINEVPDTSIAKFYLGMATAYGQMGHSDSSFHYLEELDNIAASFPNKDLQLKGLNVKGNVQMMLGNYDDAVSSFYNALEIIDNNNAYAEHSAKINGNLAGVFFDKGDFISAEKYTKKALEITIENNFQQSRAFNVLRLGLIAQAKDELDKSLKYGSEAEKLFAEMYDTTMLIYSKMNWADVLKNQKKYSEAKQKYNEALALAQSLNDPETAAACHIAIGQILSAQNKNIEATEAGELALATASGSKLKSKMLEAYNLLYSIAYKNKKFDQALNYKNKYHALSDSLNNIITNEKVVELQTRYETAQKEAEIEELSHKSQMQQLQISKTRNTMIAIIIIAGILIAGSVVLMLMRSKRMEAERIAQESQLDALKQRILQLQLESASENITIDFTEINTKIATPLTEREFETLSLSLEGKSNPEIANELFVSINTVKFHLRNIYQKLGVSNKKEALAYVAKSS